MNRPVRVGDSVVRRVNFDKSGKDAKMVRGTVIYVHSQGRHHTVEFGEAPYIFRESFFGDGRDCA